MSNQQSAGCLDPLDSLIDLSEYETVSYQSPTISPSTQKSRFSSRSVSNTPSALPSSTPTLSGPSHNYDLYRQQTGIPQGAVANTLAVNSYNSHINQYGYGDADSAGMGATEDFVDFGTAPGRNGSFNDTDVDFDSPKAEPAFFYPESNGDFIDPSSINGSLQSPNGLPSQSSSVGRLWPGMHQQQAAVAKAQRQQQQIIQQQRQATGARPGQPQRTRAPHPPTNPLVEEKISQLLNSMRQSSVTTEGDDSQNSSSGLTQTQRSKKDEEEMDEDERLLASEEGKKLSSKERRQLRNKVSARAFRSRRKEYIGQLEGEIAAKVNENTDLRTQNRALMEENTRLTDLTRMLLSSPSFSGFLDTLAQNPATTQQQSQPASATTQQGENRQVRKDVNPYAAQQQMQNQQIGVAMIPEQPMDFSMLDLNTDAFSFQPQVFSVFGIPETPIDCDVLCGKNSLLSHELTSDDEKVELPVVERGPPSVAGKVEVKEIETVDEAFDADPAFALYSSTPAPVPTPTDIDTISELLAAIPAKPDQLSLVVDSRISDDEAEAAIRKVDRICNGIERMAGRLRSLTTNL